MLAHKSTLEQDKTDRERSERERFAVLRRAQRIWAISPIHGDASRLCNLHGQIAERLLYGDRVIYLGSFLGRGAEIVPCVDELVRFRRAFLARPLTFPFDIAYLRGQQEEIWQKLLQLQFAPNPREVLTWMIQQGAGATIEAYGGNPADGIAQCRAGAVAITRWTNSLRAVMQSRAGHYQLMASLRRAAYTDDQSLLFVHAGVDPSRPLEAQGDSLWWGHPAIAELNHSYGGFHKVVRGYDQSHGGMQARPYLVTLDGGSGPAGKAIAACLDRKGEILELIEA